MARSYRARFVTAGRPRLAGNRGPAPIEITPQALREAVGQGLFDRRAVFLDHAGWMDYPSLHNLVGVTRQAEYDPAGQAVEGYLELFDTPAARLAAAIIESCLTDPGAAPDVGLSIVFYPVYAPRQAGAAAGPEAPRQVCGFRHVESVDLVFEPAIAGARILQKLSTIYLGADKMDPEEQENPVELNTQGEMAPDGVGVGAAQGAPVGAERRSAPATAATPPQGAGQIDAWTRAAAQAAASQILLAAGLPDASRARLAVQPYATPEQLQQAIAAERAYLAALQQDSVIHIGGQAPRGSSITGMLTGMDQIQLATEALIMGVRPQNGVAPLTGIRELYMRLSGDYEMSGVFQPERVSFANVTCATMASLVANALNKVIVNEFQQYPRWWEPIVTQQDFNSLQAVRWITLGGVGELPTVAEGAAYTELSWDDAYETASFVKKGGYLGITMESIDKDDTARLAAAPRALAQAAWMTISKAISSIFTANSGAGPTLVDGNALFYSSRGNLGSTALSLTTWNAARLAMRKFTELNSGERLGAIVSPKYLLVPPDLETTALQILGSELDYLYALSNGTAGRPNENAYGDSFNARLENARKRVIVVDFWTDTNDWAAVADPKLWPTIGLGFRYGRQPEVFSVASPTAGLMFSNDTMPIKVRFVFATGPMDWRGLYKANVA